MVLSLPLGEPYRKQLMAEKRLGLIGCGALGRMHAERVTKIP